MFRDVPECSGMFHVPVLSTALNAHVYVPSFNIHLIHYHFNKKNEMNALVQIVYTVWASMKLALSHGLLGRD